MTKLIAQKLWKIVYRIDMHITADLKLFFDAISEELFHEISMAPIVRSQVLLNIDRFEIGQSMLRRK